MKRGRDGQFHSGVDRLVGFHMHVMKLTIKGKSDKQAFTVAVNTESLIGFLTAAATKSEEQFDDELATSPGGWPTAIFTAMLPQKAREAVGWDLCRDGWDDEKAMAAFDFRLERKQGGGGFSLETRQKAWDEKAATLRGLEVPEAIVIQSLGKRPEAKKEAVKAGMDALKEAGIA